ncbi:hypothetical protein QCA50_017682 [Cerrena zonata]|uniref:TOG domain-containing protein n=1 Tax=Cerrena zonata TaxID=2478898 RepID=A0AAW0FJT0_9APHY
MLTEVCIDDDDAAEWNNKDDNDDEDEEPEYDAARQALDRVSLKLTGKSLAQPLFQYLPDMLQSSQWRERQAALMALSSAAEGCADVLISEIPKILDLILPSLQDNHPRVQYACCNALGQMSTDFADNIQITAGSRILPGLISMLTNKSVPRVQAHAAAALVNFSEAASKEILEPYLDDLLNNLLGLLQSQKRYVQEQVLTTIAIIADAAEKTFVKYYDTLMPLLIEVLKTDMGQESRLLKAKCIECSTLIALAVGKEKFEPHCKELIQLFGVIQESSQSDDDPVIQYLEQGWGRICRIIGKDFLPYLPAVLPPVLSAAKATQDISLLEEEEAEEFNNNEEWDVINLSGKLIAVHTAALDEKVSALDLLRTYAIQLKGDFYPFVKEIVQDIGLSALDFYLHDGVRASAALTLAALLKCSVYATGNNSEESLGLWSQISNKFIDVLTNEPVPELLVAYYTAFVEAISVLGPNCLSPEQLQNLAIAINTNLTDIFEHIKDRDNEDDEYTEEVDDNDNDYSDEELLDEINKAISSIFKNTKANFLPAFQSLIPTIASFINDENINVKLCGLCVICDLLEHAGSEFAYKEMFTDVVAESLVSPEASIRQAAAYSVGVAAQYGGSNYADYCLACLRPLFEIAVIPEARSEDNITATENVVTAIAKICRSYGASVPNLDSIVQEWVTLLPIIQDEEAAPFSYSFLAELIQNQHVAVTSQIPKVVESVLQALAHAAIGGTTAEKVVTATKQLLGALPQEEAVALLQKNPAYIDVAQKWYIDMSSYSSTSSTILSSSRSQGKRQSLGTIESSVTRLLVSTKHLLESLTRWAKQEADDKYVSDAYVKLGNDFRAATRAFTNAGVDISDIGDVPHALRIILEAALSEAPSQENLDRFLPNIRNIIVTLLQTLKSKQLKAKTLSIDKLQRAKQSEESSRSSSRANSQSHSHSHSHTSSKQLSNPEAVNDKLSPSQTATVSRQSSSHNSPKKPYIPQAPPIAPFESEDPGSGPNLPRNSPSKKLGVELNDALAQLQKGNFLQRRASKRFSAYQYAKLTNFTPPGNLPKISSADYSSSTPNNSFDSKDYPPTPTKPPSAENNAELVPIFLQIHDRTKKVNIKLPVSFAALRLLFVEKFAYSPRGTSFPDIYIKDPQSNVSYELEEHLLESDVKSGCVLCLNEEDPQKSSIRELEDKISSLTSKFDSLNSNLLSEVKDAIKTIEIPTPVVSAPTPATTAPANTKEPVPEKKSTKSISQLKAFE